MNLGLINPGPPSFERALPYSCSSAWQERFGLEYDLDIYNIVAVKDFNMGAMENKSLSLRSAERAFAGALWLVCWFSPQPKKETAYNGT